jgi:PKD repeat protein
LVENLYGGLYVVTITDGKGCNAVAKIAVDSTIMPDLSLIEDMVVCKGQSVTLTAKKGLKYLWSNGATTKTIQVTSAGDYSVTVKSNALNCQATSNTVSVKVNASPIAKFSASTPFVLFTPVNFTDQSTNAASWFWDFGDGSNSTQKNPSHSYKSLSNFTAKLTVTSSNGCTSTTSQSIAVITAVEPSDFSEFIAYPNPIVNSQQLTLEIPSSLGASRVGLTTPFGQLLFDQELSSAADETTVQIPFSTLNNGIYLLQIHVKDGIIGKKIVKN